MGGHNIYIPSRINPCLASLPDGLLSYYKFEETSGNFLDSIGSNDLTINGSVTRNQTGVIGDSVYFDGTSYNNYLSGSHPLSGKTQFTISGWVKVENGSKTLASFVGGNYSGTKFATIMNYQDSTEKFNSGYAASGNVGIGTTYSAPYGSWYLVTFRGYVMNGKLYMKGSVNNYHSTNYTPTAEDDLMSPESTLYLGKGFLNINSYIMVGWISGFAFWDRLLSDCEIDAYYNDGNGVIL